MNYVIQCDLSEGQPASLPESFGGKTAGVSLQAIAMALGLSLASSPVATFLSQNAAPSSYSHIQIREDDRHQAVLELTQTLAALAKDLSSGDQSLGDEVRAAVFDKLWDMYL